MYRAEIMQIHGAWSEAMEEVQRAYTWASQAPAQPALGGVLYRRGELHRLRGKFAEAELAYRQASQRGQTPHPGFALLRLAQGQVDAASAAIRLAVEGAHDHVSRSRLLPAEVEILVSSGDLEGAEAAADELTVLASHF